MPGPFRLILAERATGILLNFDGSWYVNTQGSRPEVLCEDLSEALAFKDRLLLQFPHGEVAIFKDANDREPMVFHAPQ
jgi:hypothetical protein